MCSSRVRPAELVSDHKWR